MFGQDKNIKREIMQALDPEDNYKGECLLLLGKKTKLVIVENQ